MDKAAEIINQLGHLQHWGLSPATNFLSHFKEKKPTQPIRVLLTGTSDIRHILKTLADISISGSVEPSKLEIYFHETHKQLLCRALLLLHILHQSHLNLQQRIQLFLDIYGNSVLKQRNSSYLSSVRVDLLNLIHNEKKVQTPLRTFTKLNLLKFEQRDQLSQIIQTWSNKIQYDIVKLRDQRLRFMFKDRYDFRSNLVDWDFTMGVAEVADILHFYHYKEWRLTGLAFQQRFSTYTQPNRTLSSYVPGRKKQQKTSCLVRGYWGDMMVSPYIAMGIQTNSDQKQLLFKKANTKYIGHSVQLTEYNLTYWLQRIETETTYSKNFQDYYRTDQEGKKKLEEKEELKKKKKLLAEEKKKQLGQIKEEDEDKHEETETQKEKNQEKENKEQEEIKEKEEKPDKKQEKNEEELDSDEEERRARIHKKNAEDIKPKEDAGKLKLFEKYGVQFYPLAMPSQSLTKPKFKQFFDVIVCGFTHSAYLTKDRYIQSTLKKGGQLHIETARYIFPKKKQQRQQLHSKLKQIAQEKPTKEGEVACVFRLDEDGKNYIVMTRTG